jgi:hypothetical protein
LVPVLGRIPKGELEVTRSADRHTVLLKLTLKRKSRVEGRSLAMRDEG